MASVLQGISNTAKDTKCEYHILLPQSDFFLFFLKKSNYKRFYISWKLVKSIKVTEKMSSYNCMKNIKVKIPLKYK